MTFSDVFFLQCVVISCVFCAVTSRDLRNVALNKPSNQVSVYKDRYGPHSQSLGNDGSRQTNHETTLNSCVHSLWETNPWWAVDLKEPTLVVRVDLTNRDAAGKHTDVDFTVVFMSVKIQSYKKFRYCIQRHTDTNCQTDRQTDAGKQQYTGLGQHRRRADKNKTKQEA